MVLHPMIHPVIQKRKSWIGTSQSDQGKTDRRKSHLFTREDQAKQAGVKKGFSAGLPPNVPTRVELSDTPKR